MWVGEILLADENERSLGHSPGVDVPLVGADLGERAAEMDRAGAAGFGVGPGDTALDREVDLERARAVTEPAVRAGDASGQPIAEDAGDGDPAPRRA